MTSAVPYQAIRAKLSEIASEYPVVDDEFVDQQLEQGSAPFLSLAGEFADEDALSVGSPSANWLREVGRVEITVFVKSTEPLITARTIADTVRNLLRYQTLTYAGEIVSTRMAHPPELGEINDGLWHSLVVPLDYWYDYLRATG